MIIDCIADLHGYQPKLDGGDLLIVAGDLTARDLPYQHEEFKEWLLAQPYARKVLIAGNHDGHIERRDLPVYDDGVDYLEDSGTEFGGLKIWGSPWTPMFYNWHFMKERGKELKAKWDKIPNDTDILITHGPSFGVLDHTYYSSRGTGCEDLRMAVECIQPRLHVFGHVHESYGQMVLKCSPRDVLCVNCAIMDHNYNPVNKPIRVIL